MRLFIIIFIFTISGNLVSAQTEKESIEQIKTHFKWINEQTNFVIAQLDNDDYLDNMPDNGAQLRGYFKNDTLYKVVEWFGPSYGIMITEYYLWKNKLIFVYDKEENFSQIIDSVDGFVGFDLSRTEVKYESRNYFVKGMEIKKIEKGKRLMKLEQPQKFISNLQLYQPLLKNKKDNQTEYEKIQGIWTSTIDSLDVIEFYGLVKTNYYEGKYIEKERIKIEKYFLYCWAINETDEYKYEIMSLTDENLTLLYLPAGKLLTYKKSNDR